jgi:hypothetical protein
VCLEETNESEPLMTCRNAQGGVETGIRICIPQATVGEGLPIGQPVSEMKAGVTLRLASIRNTGTCRSDAKGETQAARRRKGQSTDAEHRGGGARRREEGPVMGPDRRGVVIRLYQVDNPQGEDPHE